MDSELKKYISNCLRQGFSFGEIESRMVKSGYSRDAARGIVLDFSSKLNYTRAAIIGCFVLLFFVSFYLTGSGISGLSVMEYSSTYTDMVDSTATTESDLTWLRKEEGLATSISVSGFYDGRYAEIYLIMDGRRLLVWNGTGNFENACIESCAISTTNRAHLFYINMTGGMLKLNKITYTIKRKGDIESMPSFANIPDMVIPKGSVRIINLANFFPYKNSQFSFIADNLNVNINGDIASISTIDDREHYLYFTAEASGIKHMSNLIKVRTTGKEAQTIASIGTEAIRQNMLLIALIAFAITVIAILMIPLRYYSIDAIAGKLDRIRNTSLKEELSQLKKRPAGVADISKLEGKIAKIRDKVASRHMEEFTELAETFKTSEDKKGLYQKMYKIYLRMSEAEKARVHNRLMSYYNRIK